MRSRIRRQIGTLFTKDVKALHIFEKGAPQEAIIPPEFNPHQYAILLLHVAAALEHALMVQYLYAGYSLGGSNIPPEHRIKVARWQEAIFGIAKEEMGHLMTVQNLLRCIGGPLNFDRDDYPWASEFYPFDFELEPLSRPSLAKYVYAESPPPDPITGEEIWTGPEADQIRALAQGDGGPVNRVGVLYALIEKLFADSTALRDADFRDETFPFQANWDEWGRGYRLGARGAARGAALPGTPDVILMQVTSRHECLAAIRAVATQGEANPKGDTGAPSHFARFLEIFREFPVDGSWSPTRKIATNPIVVTNIEEVDQDASWQGTPIINPTSKLWGHLFNLRYQLLLLNLLHTFEYPSNVSERSYSTPRGLLLNAAFGEMYNIRALAMILVDAPLSNSTDGLLAGPPFQMPFTTDLPLDTKDRWRLHLDLLRTSNDLVERLLGASADLRRNYLLALRDTDRKTSAMIEVILHAGRLPINLRQ